MTKKKEIDKHVPAANGYEAAHQFQKQEIVSRLKCKELSTD